MSSSIKNYVFRLKPIFRCYATRSDLAGGNFNEYLDAMDKFAFQSDCLARDQRAFNWS